MFRKREMSALIATFTNRRHADEFVDALKRAGFKSNEIEVHYPQGSEAGVLGGTAVIAASQAIPEENTRSYEQEFLAGRTLVIVQASGRGGEAVAILRRCEKLHGLSQSSAVMGGTKRSFFDKLWRRRASASDYRTEGE